MTAWTNQGVRIDVALAVVMEVAVLQLHRAESAADRTAALGFNRDLWRVVRDLAPTSPMAEDRSALAGAANLVAGSTLDSEQLMELNRRFARILAGRAATDGALGHILADWRKARNAGVELEFGPWLVQVLSGFTQRQALAA